MSRPKSERGITVVIGVSHAHPPSVWTSAASAARTQARPLVRRFTELEATGAPTAPQGARYAASERSVWRRTLAPRSIASQSLISSTRWLRPPLDGMKIIPASVIAARFCASWPAAECRRVDRRPSAEHARSIASWTRADQLAARGHDVGHARVNPHHADVADALAAAVLDDQVACLERVLGGPEEAVAAPLHRRGARVIGLADKRDAGAAHADDRVHDADRDPGLLEPRPLLDVELDVRRDRAGGGLGLGDPARVEAGPRHRVDEPLAVDGCHRLDPREVEPTAEGARAEEAPVAAFLVAPRCDGERAAVRGVGLTDRLERLEPRQDAERAVEDAALGHRVDVRAREHRGGVGPERAESEGAEDVARAVHPRLEPRGGELPREPGARLFVLRRPARARHARAGQG